VALLVLATVGLGAAVAGLVTIAPAEPPPRAAFELSVDADGDTVSVTHLGGDPLDVERLRLHVAIDGTSLAHQPPVPFFTARGFRVGPTGPFNPAAHRLWEPGETASFRIASTNDPAVDAGARVRLEIYVTAGDRDHRIARLVTVVA
jgi:FlaG/FlaF family flagellin (archaellin)